MRARVAIVAALAREVAPLVRNMKRESVAGGATVYSSPAAVVAFAGMGSARAELATAAALKLGPIHRILSVGWAGGLHAKMRAGSVYWVRTVVDVSNDEAFETQTQGGSSAVTLLSLDHVATIGEKRHLHKAYSADLVDMEAAAVGRTASSEGIDFFALKAVSDGDDFDLPGLERFATAEGQFREAAFALHVALRPGLWRTVARMAQGSSQSARNLCLELEHFLAVDEKRSMRNGKA